jgi:hypothetical protein
VQIVRGRFKTDVPPTEGSWLEDLKAGAFDRLKANGVWPADKPDFFFEGAIVTSEDKTAATVRPMLAVMYAPQGDRSTGGSERSVTIFFAFSSAGTRPNLDTNPAATVVLGPMSLGLVQRYPTQGGSNKSSTPYEASWFTLSEADARKPLTVTGMIAETQSGSSFFAFLASIFNDEAVTKATADMANVILVPGARATVEANEIKEQRTAADKVDTTIADAIVKLTACHAAGKNALAKGAEAKVSLRAYLAADDALPTPLNKIDDKAVALIDLTSPDTIADRCNELHEKLTGKRL